VSLIPAFELGLWNAWILILPIIIVSVFGAKTLSNYSLFLNRAFIICL
jgi:hypothetical protein